MTDYERLIDLLESWGVGFTIEGEYKVILEVGNDKVVGYSNFASEFDFNPDGSFKEIGIWE